jgi:hypothetical protein
MTIGFPYHYVDLEVEPDMKVESEPVKFNRQIRRHKFYKKLRYGLVLYVANAGPYPHDSPPNLLQLVMVFANAAKMVLFHMLLTTKSFLLYLIRWAESQSNLVKRSIMKLATYFLSITDPYFVLYATFACSAAYGLYVMADKFGKKVRWIGVLAEIFLIMACVIGLITLLLLLKILHDKGVYSWLYYFLLSLFKKQKIKPVKLPQEEPDIFLPDKPGFGVGTNSSLAKCVFYSVLTGVTYKILLDIYKKKVVGNGPNAEIIVTMIDHWDQILQQKRRSIKF